QIPVRRRLVNFPLRSAQSVGRIVGAKAAQTMESSRAASPQGRQWHGPFPDEVSEACQPPLGCSLVAGAPGSAARISGVLGQISLDHADEKTNQKLLFARGNRRKNVLVESDMCRAQAGVESLAFGR